jgi:hypothetical protein
LKVPYFQSLEQLLSQGRPDGVILATPNAMHVTQALQCLDAGVPVLVEKPIAHTVADAQEIGRCDAVIAECCCGQGPRGSSSGAQPPDGQGASRH